jgi:hypothetical protein
MAEDEQIESASLRHSLQIAKAGHVKPMENASPESITWSQAASDCDRSKARGNLKPYNNSPERGRIRAITRPVQTLRFGRAGHSFKTTDLRAAGSFVAYSLSCGKKVLY